MAKNTKVRLVKAGLESRRICEGSCGDVHLGPLDCPEGYSPDLNCTTNPPTLKCVKDSLFIGKTPKKKPRYL